MKKIVIIALFIIANFVRIAGQAQPANSQFTDRSATYDFVYTTEEMSDPSIPEALYNYFSQDMPYDIGEGCTGPHYDQIIQAYSVKKTLLPGKACTPYFRVSCNDHYFEGQLFYSSISGISGLIRSFSGKYFAVSSDFLLKVFRLQYLCCGLPSGDWEQNNCQESLPYKTIEFTTLSCTGEQETIVLAGLYDSLPRYSNCLELKQLEWCPVPIIVTKQLP